MGWRGDKAGGGGLRTDFLPRITDVLDYTDSLSAFDARELSTRPLRYFPIRVIQNIRDGMKSFSNRRWANRKDLFNVPRGARECLQRARAAEGPNGSTITMS